MTRIVAVAALMLTVAFLAAGYVDYRRLIAKRDQLDQGNDWTEDEL